MGYVWKTNKMQPLLFSPRSTTWSSILCSNINKHRSQWKTNVIAILYCLRCTMDIIHFILQRVVLKMEIFITHKIILMFRLTQKAYCDGQRTQSNREFPDGPPKLLVLNIDYFVTSGILTENDIPFAIRFLGRRCTCIIIMKLLNSKELVYIYHFLSWKETPCKKIWHVFFLAITNYCDPTYFNILISDINCMRSLSLATSTIPARYTATAHGWCMMDWRREKIQEQVWVQDHLKGHQHIVFTYDITIQKVRHTSSICVSLHFSKLNAKFKM